MMTFIIFIGYDRKRKAERRRRPDDMFCNTCKSTLLTHILETAVLQKTHKKHPKKTIVKTFKI